MIRLGAQTLRLGSVILDLLVAAASFIGAYAVVYGPAPLAYIPQLGIKTLVFTLIAGVSFFIFSVTRGSWRYVSIPELVAVIKASLFTVAVYTIGEFLVSRGANVPRSVPLLMTMFLVGGLATMRLAYRLANETSLVMPFRTGRDMQQRHRKVLVLGISPEAEGFIRGARRPGSAFHVLGILDPDPSNRMQSVQGVKVMGALDDLPRLVEAFKARRVGINEVVVAELAPSRQRLNTIFKAATACGLKVSRIPAMTETSSIIQGGRVEPKPMELGDLLGRPEVNTDIQGVAKLIEGKTVLATGAGGSIGSEICRQVALFNPKRLVLADSSEFHAYLLDKEMRQRFPHLEIHTLLVNVRDAARVTEVCREFRPEVVFHAAALKHVPMVEDNPLEAIKTNVFGTRNVADAALACDASAFIMISTDKAVNPTNIMGATKRAAEAYCQALDLNSEKTRFKTVRFGNVLGSNGSVVPLFQEQIARGGPVTVTHPNIVRYFMTIPEAVRLVLHASTHALGDRAERGRIMVLDMGKPVRIVDLAERMIQLAGFKPRVDIDIVFTGLRQGEKLYEELFDPSEVQDHSSEEGFVIAAPRVVDAELLARMLSNLENAVRREDRSRAVEILTHIVPEYRRADHTAGGRNIRRADPIDYAMD